MQKTKNKRMQNSVGTYCICPKKQQGITLIALIITIIVMLILVGVTINVALNGNLFEKAKTAATQTEEQAIYDQIVGAMDLGNNGKILVKETYSATKSTLEGQGKTVNLVSPSSDAEITNSAVLEVVGNNGTYTYTITEKKIIIGKEQVKSGIHVGDKWTNVSLSNLPTDEPTGFTDYVQIFIENNETGEIWLLAYTYDTDISRSIMALGYENMENDNIEMGLESYYWTYYYNEHDDETYEANQWTRTREGDQSTIKHEITGEIKGIAVNGVLDSGTLENTTISNLAIRDWLDYDSEDENVQVPMEFVNWFTGTFDYAE